MPVALVALRDFGVEEALLSERPFMAVANPEGHEKWMLRWDCVYEQVRFPLPAPSHAFTFSSACHPSPDGLATVWKHGRGWSKGCRSPPEKRGQWATLFPLVRIDPTVDPNLPPQRFFF